MVDYGLTDAGYIPTPTSVIEETIQGDYESLTGIAARWDYDEFLGAFTLCVSRRIGSLELATQALSDSRSSNNAQGLALDDQGQARLTPRLAESKTRTTCVLTSESDTTKIVPVPAGSIVRGGGVDGRQQWQTVEDASIPSAGGTVNVVVEALDYGPISVNAAEVTEIVTAINGWASVTNTSDVTIGTAAETDYAYRRRQALASAKAGSATTQAIRSNVLAVQNVTACNVLENEEPTTQTVEGVSMEGKAIAVYVQPSTLTAGEQEAVAAAVYQRKAAGIKTLGSVSATVTGADDLSKTVKFSFFTEITVNVATTLTLATGYVLADVQDDVEEIIVEYFGERLGGDDAYRLDIATRIKTLFPQAVLAASILLNGVDADVTTNGSEIVVLGTNLVS